MSQHEVAEDRSANLAEVEMSAAIAEVHAGDESSSPLKSDSKKAFIGAGEIRAIDENVVLEPVDLVKLKEITKNQEEAIEVI